MKDSQRKAIHAKKKERFVDVVLSPKGDHIQSIIEPNVSNSLINKKSDEFGFPHVKGHDGWKDKQGTKRDFSSATRETYSVQTKESLKRDLKR